MKTKFLAIVLSILCLIQPVAAIGMVGVESAAEVVSVIPEQVQEETQEAAVMAEQPANVLFFDDFESNEVKEINALGSGASYTPAYRKDGVTVKFGSTDRTAPTVDGVEYPSNPHWKIIDENGDKVLFISQYAGDFNNIGLDFNSIKFHDPGVYTLSFSLKTELGKNAEGFGESAGADFTWFQTEKKNAAGTTSGYNLTCSGINGTNGNANLGKWYNVSYRFIVTDNGDGTRSIAAKSNLNPWNPAARTLADGEYLSRLRHYFKLYPAKISQGYLYLDDIKLTFDAAVNVTYVDNNGETLATALNYGGDTITLSKATVGYTYPVQFEINGVKYDDGAAYTIPHEITNLTIKATGYDMPANAPVNAILFEDFDYTTVTNSSNGIMKYIDRDFFGSSVPFVGQYGSPYDYSYGEFDGKSVLNIGGKDESYEGIHLKDLNLNKPGKYITTFKYYSEVDDTNYTVTSSDFNLCAYEIVDGAEIDRGQDTSTFATNLAKQRNKWVETTETLIITEDESGQLYRGTTAISQINRMLWYIKQNDTSASKETSAFSWINHLDKVSIQYFAPVTVKYVDDSGNTLKTYETFQNAEYALPSATDMGYITTFTYAGETYNLGETFTVPADATSEIIIAATRRTMPSTLPTNTVFYEDFQNRTVGAKVSSTAVSYTTEAFDGTLIDQCEGTPISETYEYAPDSDSNIAMKLVTNSMYVNSMIVNLPDDIEVGRYAVYNSFYIDTDIKDTSDLDGDSNVDEYVNSISEWCRVWYGKEVKENDVVIDDGFVGASTTATYNKAENRKAWNKYSFEFEVYEESGEKYVKMGSESHVVTGDIYLKLHFTASNAATSNVTIYHDDVYMTQVKPVTYTATFIDEDAESFAYSVSEENYDGTVTLPTATELGLGYEPKFTVDGTKFYYPGMTYTIPEGTTAEFIVSKSNVILFENYTGNAATTLKPMYASGAAANVKLASGSVAGHKNYGWNNLSAGGSTQYVLTGMDFSQPGVYSFSADVELETIKASDKSHYVQVAFQHSDWTQLKDKVNLTPENPTATIGGTITITRNAEGKLCFERYGTTRVVDDYLAATSDKNHFYGVKFGFDIGGYASDVADEDKAVYTLHFTNLTVTFEPYAPNTVKMTSFRPENADGKGGPAGIRFAAYVSASQEAECTEYGYVVTRKALLKNTDGTTYDYSKLNINGVDSIPLSTVTVTNSDGVKVAAIAAHKGSVSRIFTHDGEIFTNNQMTYKGVYDTFFTCVVHGITTDKQKAEIFVVRPYAMVDGVYYYGDCHETSYAEVYAKANL